MNLSEEMIKRIHRMACKTWESIGEDIFTMLEEQGEKTIMTKTEVVETVCDADYMFFHGGDKEAYNIWNQLPIKEGLELVKKAFPFPKYRR